MKRLSMKLWRSLGKTTLRFLLFYLLLVLVPTVIFISIYTDNVQQQAITNQRYELEKTLKHSSQMLSHALEESRLIADTIQSSTPLLTLLGGAYPSAADELYAYSAYIRPLLDSLHALAPALDNLYFYRRYPSFISNQGVVQNLCDIGDMPYAYDVNSSSQSFLAVEADQFFHREIDLPEGPRYVSLYNIYSSDYSQVVAVLEVQLRLDTMLQNTLPSLDGGQLYLGYGDVFYPLRQEIGGFVMENKACQRPSATPSFLQLEESVQDMSLLWQVPLTSTYEQIHHATIRMILLMLIPMVVFWLYMLRYTRGITRFRKHIHAAGHTVPRPYGGHVSGEELGDVVREYNAMTQTIVELIDSVQEAERLKNAASYYAMTSQVNPHFMFNTLENIRMHIELEHYNDANQMLFTLSRYLRYNISLREESRLEEEFEHIRHYILIYQYRINHMITLEIRRDDDVPNVLCPVHILQPIVENCLKHGVKSLHDPLHIDVHAYLQGDDLCIAVCDDGSGMSEERICELNHRLRIGEARRQEQAADHIGLDNVNARIKYFYGPDYGLSFSKNEHTGVTCRIHIGMEKSPTLQGGKRV